VFVSEGHEHSQALSSALITRRDLDEAVRKKVGRAGAAIELATLERAAAIMSLIQSAKLNGHDPYAYLKDVFTRLPTHSASRVGELLPHRWQPANTSRIYAGEAGTSRRVRRALTLLRCFDGDP